MSRQCHQWLGILSTESRLTAGPRPYRRWTPLRLFSGLPQPVSVFVQKQIFACSTVQEHRFEDFFKDTHDLHRKRCQGNGSNTLAAVCLCFTKETHTALRPIYIAASYRQQLTCTSPSLGLENNCCIVLGPQVRQWMTRQVFSPQELVKFFKQC
jgi:hypothetical protein